MPVPPRPLPQRLRGPFRSAELDAFGIPRTRLRARDLEAPFHGVHRPVGPARPPMGATTADADTPLERARATRRKVMSAVRAYELVRVPHAFYAGRTAAIIHGATIAHSDDLEIAVPRLESRVRRRGIRARRISPTLFEVRSIGGVPVASPATTWAMLGGDLSVRDLVRLGDELARIPRDDRGRPRPELQAATLDELHAALAMGPRRGAAKLRAALRLVRVGSFSHLETDWRVQVVEAGLPEPELDVEIRDVDGRLVGIADAVFREARVLAEIEGDHHRTDRRQWARDIEKHAAYAALGYELVRVTADHIHGPYPSAPDRLRAVLLRRGWRP